MGGGTQGHGDPCYWEPPYHRNKVLFFEMKGDYYRCFADSPRKT